MARRDVTLVEALTAVQSHLKSQLGLSERQAVFRIDPDSPPIPIGAGDDEGKFSIGVSPGPMMYPDYWGDPVNHGTVDMGFYITSTSRVFLDDANNESAALMDAERGLLVVQRKIIKAMVTIGAELPLPDDDVFLHDSMRPVGDARPGSGFIVNADGDDESIPVYFQTINFVGRFDLDLVSED